MARDRMPALFIGHGSPMNAIEDNEFRRSWTEVARLIPRPRAVLCVSAHWETPDVRLTASESPETIHDFGGFPRELFAIRYPAPGSPALARRVGGLLQRVRAGLDPERGLDHGCWSVLLAMYPEADLPVVQLSLMTSRAGPFHYELAADLKPLRDEGVLLLGSGNIVHNLGLMDFQRADGYDWAEHFNDEVKRRILAGDHAALYDLSALSPDARLAVPGPEHFLPLLYVLALRAEGDAVALFNDRTIMGSIAMTSVLVGGAPGDGAALTGFDRSPGRGTSR